MLLQPFFFLHQYIAPVLLLPTPRCCFCPSFHIQMLLPPQPLLPRPEATPPSPHQAKMSTTSPLPKERRFTTSSSRDARQDVPSPWSFPRPRRSIKTPLPWPRRSINTPLLWPRRPIYTPLPWPRLWDQPVQDGAPSSALPTVNYHTVAGSTAPTSVLTWEPREAGGRLTRLLP